MLLGPNPNTLYPLKDNKQLIFLKNIIEAKNIFVGDYTYFDDRKHDPLKFEENNVLYNYDLDRVKLVIGKFCAIASDTRFLMTGDHKLDAISTYPFIIFQEGWENAFDYNEFPVKGDIIVGHDVWFGYNSFVKGGVNIGHGAIVAANAVVVKDVPPYAIVAGNPAKVVKMRFDDKTVKKLLQISWWDWSIQHITEHLSVICDAEVDRLVDIYYTKIIQN